MNIKYTPIDDCGDHLPLGEWIDCVKCGAFIDYDGFGYYATETQETNVRVIPSDVANGKIDTTWTHIVWYNR
jgi:hypothetical protein